MRFVRPLLAALVLGLSLAVAVAVAASASAELRVHWMAGTRSPGTPARYDKIGVLKIGPAHAKNVLVLVPGTSAGSAYFVPLARWILSDAPGWQVWSIERRENLLEDQSVLNRAKAGHASATELFDYYLGFLTGHHYAHTFKLIPDSRVEFAKRWGMAMLVDDLHRVITAARKLGGKVVLGGHSLGGAVVTAYATWDFGGHAGADTLDGLVYIDGGSFGASESAASARTTLQKLDAPSTSPWLTFGPFPAPYAGLYNATGSTAALIAPNARSLGQSSGLLGAAGLTPSVPVTNLGQYGYALNVGTSPASLIAAQAHLGRGISSHGAVRGWDRRGALTPIKRYAQMFSGTGVANADGTEWYFPQRLADDGAAIGNGTASASQRFLGLHATMGRHLPHRLFIYGFGAAIGGKNGLILNEARRLAVQSGIPLSHLTLINRYGTYAHNDPNGAYPHNVFFAHLIPFLKRVATGGP